MDAKLFTCYICGKTATRKYNLLQHIQTHKPRLSLSCHKCHKTFGRERTLKTHACGVERKPTFKCETCCKLFSRKGNLNVHKLSCDLKKVTSNHPLNYDIIKTDLAEKTRLFHETLKYGEFVNKVLLDNPKLKEEAIEKNSHQYKALRLYRTKIKTESLDTCNVV